MIKSFCGLKIIKLSEGKHCKTSRMRQPIAKFKDMIEGGEMVGKGERDFF